MAGRRPAALHAATTVDTQCGSSQQATNLATVAGRRRRGRRRRGLRRRVDEPDPDRLNARKKLGLGCRSRRPTSPLRDDVAVRGRRAHRREVGHHPRGHGPLRPRQPAAGRAGWAEDRFAGSTSESMRPTSTRTASPPARPTPWRDEGMRETTLEKLAQLKPVAREDGVHTAGNSSQISDGAAAVLLMTEDKAAELGLTRGRVVDTCLVGVDPVLMLTGPIDATQRLLERTGLSIDDIDTFEINEAFAPSCSLGHGGRARPGEGEPERRRDRPRPPARRHRRGPDDEGALRAGAHRRALRPDHVLRRRPGHRHDHRAARERPRSAPRVLLGRWPLIDRLRPAATKGHRLGALLEHRQRPGHRSTRRGTCCPRSRRSGSGPRAPTPS